MPAVSLDDLKKKEEEDKKKTTSYIGGEKSGLAVENPPDPQEDDQFARMAKHRAEEGPPPDGASTVTVYKNGFTVGDGPFRPNSDPINKKFMDELASGRAPQELEAANGGDVHVAVVDKRGEEFKEPPKPSYTAFSGEGNSLGGASSSSAGPVQADAGSVAVDASKPKTKVQIKFQDGSKKAQEFNEDHTVGDLRNFCSQCVGGTAMTIMGGFPPKPLTDDSQTIKAAGLCGAAVTVRPA